MKKPLIIVFLACLIACKPATPTLAKRVALTETTTPSPLTAVFVSTSTTVVDVLTVSPKASPVMSEGVNVPFTSTEWSLWFAYEDSPFALTTDSQEKMWARVQDKVAYFDGHGWASVKPNVANINQLSQLHVARDGTIWVLGRRAQETFLAHFDKANWREFVLPESIVAARLITMAIDATNQVWIGAMDCSTKHCLFTFADGDWREEQLPVHNQELGGVDVISDSEGNIWVCGGGYEGIAERLANNNWHFFRGNDIWAKMPYVGFRQAEYIHIEAGLNGSIWIYLESTSDIIHIKKDGTIENLPIGLSIDYQNLRYITLHESRRGLLWIGIDQRSSFLQQESTILGYFNGIQWVSFADLPFKLINSIDETPDGVILVLTENDLYRYQLR